MNVAVLGASGFIGGAVADALHAEGIALTVIGRVGGGLDAARWPGARPLEVDYAAPGALARALAGSAAVVNCIANVHGADMSRAAFLAVEVELTARIAAACRDVGAGLVQLSSIIAFGWDLPRAPVDESYVGTRFDMIDELCLEREAAVRGEAARGGAGFALLRPVPVLGRRDKGSTLRRVLEARRAEGFPLVDGGEARVSLVDARDLGRAMTLALRSFEAIRGRTLIVGGIAPTWREVKRALDEVDGRPSPERHLTPAEAEAHLGRRTAGFLGTSRVFEDRAFRAAVGYAPRFDLAASLRHAVG